MHRYFLFLLLYFLNESHAKSFFSSKIIGEDFLTLIAFEDKAMVQKLNTKQQVATIEYNQVGQPLISNQPNIDYNKIQDIQGQFEYYIPDDKCYMLQNLHKVCVDKGKIITNVKYSSKVSAEEDPFFNQENDECNIFKFLIAYKIFLLNKKIEFEQYQIAINGYPDFIKIVIIDYNAMIKDISHVNFDTSNNLRIFYVSSFNNIGCVPYQKLKLYNQGESQIYKMHIDNYRLVGPIYNELKDGASFIEIEKSRVTKYDRSLINKRNTTS